MENETPEKIRKNKKPFKILCRWIGYEKVFTSEGASTHPQLRLLQLTAIQGLISKELPS